jgi:hypothetical protein
LETILAGQANRTDLAAKARDIDGHLMTDPLEFGESRYENVRMGFVLPLGVEYEVFEDIRTVIVHGVWRIAGH